MHRYNPGLRELDDAIGGIEGGTNVMLIGPPMCGKRALLNSIMAGGLRSGETVVLADTRVPGRDALERPKPPEGALIGVDEPGPADAGHVRLCIDSLSTILMYSKLTTVFRFMHVIAGQVAMHRNLGVYIVDENMHDPHTIATLKQLFNAVLQAKGESDRTFLRAIGFTPRPRPCFEYEVIDHSAVTRRPADD